MNLEIYKPLNSKDYKKNCLKNPFIQKPPFRKILVGYSGSGKTNLIKNFLFNNDFNYNQYFDLIYIMCGSLDDTIEYSRLTKNKKVNFFDYDKKEFIEKKMYLKDKIKFLENPNESSIKKIINELENINFYNDKKILFVMDDLIVDDLLKNTVKMNVIDELFIRGRHIAGGISTIISSQKYKALKPNLRTLNSTNLYLFHGIPKKELKLISEEIAGSYDDEEFKLIYNSYVDKKYKFLIVNLKEERERYLQDYNFEYINVDVGLDI